jgi:hypothetical protein
VHLSKSKKTPDNSPFHVVNTVLPVHGTRLVAFPTHSRGDRVPCCPVCMVSYGFLVIPDVLPVLGFASTHYTVNNFAKKMLKFVRLRSTVFFHPQP